MGVDEFLEKAHSLAADVVQIADNLPLPSTEKDYLLYLKSQAESKGLSIELGMRGIDPGALARMIEACETVGSQVLRVVASSHVSVPGEEVVAPPEEELDSIVRSIRDVSGKAADAGISIAIENHSGISSLDLLRVLERIDRPNVGVCLDTANSLACLEDPVYTVRLLSPHAFTVHLKDFRVVARYPGPGFEVIGAILGRGHLPIKDVLEMLKANCPDAAVHVELFVGMLESEEATLELEDRAVRDSVETLRKEASGNRWRDDKAGNFE